MKIYAKKGESQQAVLNDGITKKAAGLGAEYIPMESERPTPEHVAAMGGVWVLPEPEAIQSNE
jgi:hypothetical protein